MREKSIFNYIWVGTCLRYLQDVREGWHVHEADCILDNIKHFLDNLEKNEMYITKRASYDLIEIQKELAAKPKDYILTSADAKKLCDIMNSIRKTFEAEADGMSAYIVADKRLDIKKLLNNVDQLFRPEVFQLLPEIARYDFKEAGLCIAFERPTAAAFHILRGTEDVLRIYYKKYMRPAKENLTWGQIINELKGKKSGKKPNVVLINNLENIRESFRNPTQHPDKIYDIHEAQDLFNLCIDVVNRMASVFKN